MKRSFVAIMLWAAFCILSVYVLTAGSGDAHGVLICVNVYYAAFLILKELEERK